MATYRKADDLAGLVSAVMKKWHKKLKDAGVTVSVLYAHAPRDKETGEPTGPALKLHGSICAAVIKINSHKARVAGMTDAEITVDGDRWNDWTEAQHQALIDHELEHLELVIGEDGEVKLDDCHRPKLKTRPHDHEIGVFESVAQRHGANSFEAKQYKPLHHFFSQQTFPWG